MACLTASTSLALRKVTSVNELVNYVTGLFPGLTEDDLWELLLQIRKAHPERPLAASPVQLLERIRPLIEAKRSGKSGAAKTSKKFPTIPETTAPSKTSEKLL